MKIDLEFDYDELTVVVREETQAPEGSAATSHLGFLYLVRVNEDFVRLNPSEQLEHIAAELKKANL